MAIDSALRRLSETLSAGPASAQALERLNKKLNALHLGVELFLAESPFCTDRDSGTAWVLGYAKVAREGWCLAVRPVLLRSGDPGVYRGPAQSLLKAGRPIQIGAGKLLPALFEELRGRVHTTMRSIQWARLLPEAFARIHYEAPRQAGKTHPHGPTQHRARRSLREKQ